MCIRDRPEFLNRVDEIVCFNHLTKENFAGIARIMLDELKASLGDKGYTPVSYTHLDVYKRQELLYRLRRDGVDVPLENLTVDECADTICRAFGEAEGK